MQLLLENFRQHKNLELVIPDSGLIMLKGASGAGKSTIFDAILFALYGEAEDVTPWGESKCKVTLFIGEMTIIRTKGPVSLKVTESSQDYRDDVAQGRINQFLGMGLQEFLASSYARQGMEGSLLSLPPAEQLRFIQELALGDYDPEVLKDKISNYIKDKNLLLSKNEGIISVLEQSILKQKDQISLKQKEIPKEPVKPKTEYNQETANINVKERQQFSILHKDWVSKFNSPILSALDKLEHSKERFLNIKEKHEGLILDLEKKLSTLQAMNKEELDLFKAKIDKKSKFLDSKQKLINAINKFYNEFPEHHGKKLSILLPEEIKRITHELNQNSSKTEEQKNRLNELDRASRVYECPSCSSRLCIHENKLIINESEINTDVLKTEIRNQINENKKTNDNLLKLKDSYSFTLKMCDQLKKDIEVDSEPDTSLETLKCQLDEEVIKSSTVIELSSQINRFKNEVLKEENEVNKLLSIIGNNKHPTKEEIQEKINDLNKQIELIDKKIQEDFVLEKEWSDYNSSMNLINHIKESIHVETNKLKEMGIQLEKEKNNKDILIEKLAASKKIKELTDFASISACDLILENINENARNYLDKFFPEDGTSIVLKNSTVTKSGNERPKLSLSVYHKGKEAKKLSNLSGGEKSRVYLAFQLALSEMYKSPILLIDEGFAGLPLDQKAECLEYLREFAENRLVFVIEHGANDEQFQQVISFN